jgi:hypothetical protein
MAGRALTSRSLYGVTCLQVYSYYVDYGRADRAFLKSLVRLLVHICNAGAS